MNTGLSNFAARLRQWISTGGDVRLPGALGATEFNHEPPHARVAQVPERGSVSRSTLKSGGLSGFVLPPAAKFPRFLSSATPPHVGCDDADFNARALELFALQFRFNPAYQRLCTARGRTPERVEHWTQIPAAPTVAFKELELSCLTPEERTVVFHSSGTTEQKPSRHFHRAESLAVYEASLLAGFERHLGPGDGVFFLTPGRSAAPHSSLIYMFDTVRRRRALPESVFLGTPAGDGSWTVDFLAVIRALQSARISGQPLMLLGTAFSFVHLLDYLAENHVRFHLPAGSRVMETGGYKNRSRTLSKAGLHEMIRDGLGVPLAQIVCEYGMCELSSQAYAVGDEENHFPPWARVQIVSPETGREVAEGGTGILRVFDLANVFSVAAIQTEDLAVRRGDGFELIGRAERAEPRGCSLMAV